MLVQLLVLATTVTIQETPRSQEIDAQVVETLSVELDQEVATTVPEGSALRLDCGPNTPGLDNLILWFSPDGELWVHARDRDGYEIESSSTFQRRCDALLYQLGRTTLLVDARWTWDGDRADVVARISSDGKHNLAKYYEAQESEGRTALLLRSDAPFPAASIDEDERIAGFTRLWSAVKYNFAFFDQVPDLDWDAVLTETLPAVRTAETAGEYYRVLERCLAQLQDGHTDVWGPGIGVRGDSHLPLRLEFDTERKLRIAAVTAIDDMHDSSQRELLGSAALERGMVITHWDGRVLDELLDSELRPAICASTPQGSDLKSARRLSSGDNGSRVTLRVQGSDGVARDVVLQRGRFPLPSVGQREFGITELREGVLRIDLPSFSSSQGLDLVRREWPRIRLATALIFDIRSNGGGNSMHGWNIVRRLIDETVPTTAWKTRSYRPAFAAWGRPEEWHEGEPDDLLPESDPFLGPVAVLVGPRTFSAAEDFAAVLHAARRAAIVGRPTGGSTGQPMQIELPGGGGARVCTKRDTYPDGTEFVGVGIQPTHPIDPFSAPSSEDPELERALELVLIEANGGEPAAGR